MIASSYSPTMHTKRNRGEYPHFEISGEIAQALDQNAPVVALETCVVARGLPRPMNLETAQQLELLVRREGATPATIGVLGGQIKVGLSGEELEHMATEREVRKVSRRELPIVAALGLDGATTVAATLCVAHRVGIEVLATGGIGGVHLRHPFDVSADLPEIASTSSVVVCAGAKSILDLPRTVEWLETHAVPVLGYGTDRFPNFYSRDSGLPVSARVDTPDEAARIIQTKRDLGLEGGILLAVPIPETDEVPPSTIESVLNEALSLAQEQGIMGQPLSPFLLERIAELTNGASVKANVALLKNNVIIAARVARALAA